MNKFIRKVPVEQYQEDTKKVLELFYRTELRPGEVLIDNTDRTIAKELGFTISYVCNIITKDLNKKFDKINSRS